MSPLLLAVLFAAWNSLSVATVNYSTFPFAGCDQALYENRWRASWQSYTENAAAGSRLCVALTELPLAPSPQFPGWGGCQARHKRCCDTGVNKFKWLPAPACLGQVSDITLNGVYTGAVEYDNVFSPSFIGKITNLQIPSLGPAGGLGGILCFNLTGTSRGGTCPTFRQWPGSDAAYNYGLLDKMPVALYDVKADGYECCPVSILTPPATKKAPRRSLQLAL